jgi:hypothetical protein
VKLFLDLDGVLADFDRGVHAVTGNRPEELPLKTMWAALSRAPRFFETLAFMHDAEALWRFCAPHRPTILTGLPLGTWAPDQKRRWVARVLGAHVPIITCMSRDKPRWSGPGHVLVGMTVPRRGRAGSARAAASSTMSRRSKASPGYGSSGSRDEGSSFRRHAASRLRAPRWRGTTTGRGRMADKHDDHKVPEMPAVDAARLKGEMPQQPSGTGGGLSGGNGLASGHNPGGTLPGGGPAAGLGSLGTGNAETGGAATGSVKRGGR